jgi:hypothetical protein
MGGEVILVPSCFVLQAESLMKYTGWHENDLTARSYSSLRSTAASALCIAAARPSTAAATAAL